MLMPKPKNDRPDSMPLGKDALPISAPARSRSKTPPAEGAPDLHIEEIEEKHIPKDRNVFDK
jgi:hypothetical protein